MCCRSPAATKTTGPSPRAAGTAVGEAMRTAAAAPGSDPPSAFLGDVAVCPAVADHYAAADGHPLAVELGRLIVHGVLHVLGWDHENDQGEMRLREEFVLTQVNDLLPALTAET